ncbi:MAG: SIS domain-containing protein [Sphingomonadales bacterium]
MNASVKQIALQTIDLEARSIQALRGSINSDFENAVRLMADCKGRVVVSGIGKSAVIAQKLAATFNSTGTPSLFMHAADATHGDLGMIRPEDVVIIISKSGESPEIRVLLPLIRNFGNPLIAIVGNTTSSLAQEATCILDTTVEAEACPNNLAPTSSTTAQLVMGDALAVCLMELKGFNSDDFARYHPGGALGKKLYLRVGDLSSKNSMPQIGPTQSIREVIVSMTTGRLGVTVVTDETRHVLGIVTDGDLRRMLEKGTPIDSLTAADIMTPSPRVIHPDELAVVALEVLTKHHISQLVVADEKNYRGVLHIHDLMREGLI